MKGYKIFNPDWTCKGMQYEVGKTYEMEESPIICERGFHFCEKAADCFNYYSFNPINKVAEVEAYGEIDYEISGSEDTKICTNKIKIVRELEWREVLDLVNIGKDCTGLCNSSNWNSGNNNSNNWNSSSRNSGNRNGGNWNSGDYNSGDSNSGNWNSGNWNSGNWNSGDFNSGDCNSGDSNSGNYNSGNWNSGDWNHASNCVGCFNAVDKPIMFFDKPSNITLKEWRNSDAYWLLNKINLRPVEWIWSNDMTYVKRENHPEHKTTGGYLKIRDNSDCYIEWWKGLTDEEKAIIKAIPNFDSEKFYKITGINVEKD